MPVQNLFYAQSGGCTPVINATASGVIQAARRSKRIDKILIGKNGILGGLHEELIDIAKETPANLKKLIHTPGCAFGTCRYKLSEPENRVAEFERLLQVFSAHNIGYFLYNGGNDSQDTTHKMMRYSKSVDYPLQCIGIPKTIDNDLAITDNCPGFGSVAKYIAVTTSEVGLDVASMSASSTKVFIMEVMGRHAGWLAAAAGLAAENSHEAPHIILFPEVPFEQAAFLAKVRDCVNQYGNCVVVASEGVRSRDGKFLVNDDNMDSFGHSQLGGLAPMLAARVKKVLGYKIHWSVVDYLQRGARHLASQTDLEQAVAVGMHAVKMALLGQNGQMPIIVRNPGRSYSWSVDSAPVSSIANQEHTVPRNWITREGFGITAKAREYLLPLIQGEAYPPYRNGLPDYARLKLKMVRKKLTAFQDLD